MLLNVLKIMLQDKSSIRLIEQRLSTARNKLITAAIRYNVIYDRNCQLCERKLFNITTISTFAEGQTHLIGGYLFAAQASGRQGTTKLFSMQSEIKFARFFT